MAKPGDLQQFLDSNQYSRRSVLRYEKIFGRTFLSTGGRETTDKFLNKLDIKAGDRVLDVGCGIGGSAFIMDLQYGAIVRGVDLSTNMINIALERQKEVGSKNTSFHLEDITKGEYGEEEFDLIYSRDTILHIEDKVSLYKNFLRWLKPGGRLFVTDYSCRGEGHTEEFCEYVKQRGYHLLSPVQYRDLVQEAGFTEVKVDDLTDMFVDILTRERARAVTMKDEFIGETSEEDFNRVVGDWERKINRVKEGSQRWLSVTARKPA